MREPPCRALPAMSHLDAGQADGLGRSEMLFAPEAFGALRIAVQQRKIAAIHHQLCAGEDAIDVLAQRRVLPLNGRNFARVRIEQHRRNFPAGYALQVTVERAKLGCESGSLQGRELGALHQRARALAGQTAVEALHGVQARPKIGVERDQESGAQAVDGVVGEPELVRTVEVVEQDMTAVAGHYLCQDWNELIGFDRASGSERSGSRHHYNSIR